MEMQYGYLILIDLNRTVTPAGFIASEILSDPAAMIFSALFPVARARFTKPRFR